MTLASVVSTFTRLKVDALLAIDGIPILFGTRADRVWSTSGTDPVSEHPASWTTRVLTVCGPPAAPTL